MTIWVILFCLVPLTLSAPVKEYSSKHQLEVNQDEQTKPLKREEIQKNGIIIEVQENDYEDPTTNFESDENMAQIKKDSVTEEEKRNEIYTMDYDEKKKNPVSSSKKHVVEKRTVAGALTRDIPINAPLPTLPDTRKYFESNKNCSNKSQNRVQVDSANEIVPERYAQKYNDPVSNPKRHMVEKRERPFDEKQNIGRTISHVETTTTNKYQFEVEPLQKKTIYIPPNVLLTTEKLRTY